MAAAVGVEEHPAGIELHEFGELRRQQLLFQGNIVKFEVAAGAVTMNFAGRDREDVALQHAGEAFPRFAGRKMVGGMAIGDQHQFPVVMGVRHHRRLLGDAGDREREIRFRKDARSGVCFHAE
ncbi:hypothetical protein SDC9_142028 [bioreactor metagenome]|uniref:Uncharacterized protein n=1 Tax=bioreactor metagenome TaxID=1076179 RepID=A0A645E035_9ZZZZ